MCGIVGYIGKEDALDVLINGLEKLEYRGYDSAGVSFIDDGEIKITKTKGRIDDLKKQINGYKNGASIGLGHTRWATHGKPSDENSHPHCDCSGKISLVHNGIIENYKVLKQMLKEKGHNFISETDTEVISHLIEEYHEGDLIEAVKKAGKELKGSFALAVMEENGEDKIICLRKDSPLVIGVGDGENIIASDIPAILNHTDEVLILEDGDLAVVDDKEVTVYDIEGQKLEKQTYKVDWDAEEAEKGGYEHFMLKEIHEQPQALKNTLRGRFDDNRNLVELDELSLTKEEINSFDKIYMVACGTAYHAGLVGKAVFENMVKCPVEVDIASEYRYREPLITDNTLVIVISQSGETADTLAALRESKKWGAKVIAITNVVGSTVSREADEVMYTWAGPEIAVASTKAYLTQLLALNLLGIYFARIRNSAPEKRLNQLSLDLSRMPELLEKVYEQEDDLKEMAGKIAKWESTFFIGRALDWAVCEEGALKLKEISYIQAEAYAAGELKHGTLALITEGVPVITLVTQPHVYEKTISNLQEVKARGANGFALAFEDDETIHQEADNVMTIPRVDTLLTPILSVVPLQLISYYAATARGSDVDKPRNLAKSVTVE
ncbi:glutamine--fructose-6-phosphate transaminase (isomerizing) [Natranaerofaba carboxydovora]|uniref:glutamine--fructose-6-phosphate transaminase (isomerizing) n=1 Tax=Natranaerofaba carboxydovora TaxID=2742683 RepID=UPI001F147189|nr:glutamine--fructose-6-phosphate transaminase (isomerizing) [Natranaerofaba carboxydovora]UMZ75436.1 Glutamine--fructose-6-phosphate aminotransferase [isomerizing] [Natranaerofaba carboxydovora]